MFGMELWFVAAIISVLGVGIHSYTHKVASVRGYNSALISSYGMGISSALMFLTAFLLDGSQTVSLLMFGTALTTGVVYLIGSNLRIDALRCLDATIALPIHKIVSPLVAILLGVFFLQEGFTFYEWFGLGMSMLIPALLISRHEKGRQKNLFKGLILISLSSFAAAIVAFLNKVGADLFVSVLFFGAVTNSLGTAIGVLQYRLRKKNTVGIEEVHHFDSRMLRLVFFGSIAQYIGFSSFLLAFDLGGSLGIVYTINSLYILIPIILSIIIYKEHWNVRKIIAIVLSVAALALLK